MIHQPAGVGDIFHVSNAIKLVHICVIGQQLTQLFAWGLHQRILFGTPFADTRFVPRGPVGIHDQ